MKKKYIISIFFPLSLLLLSFASAIGYTTDATEPDAKMGFIGAETCQECHEAQYESYSKSVHFQKSIKGTQ
jgi:nitrate/TMAO reductase-like tetraheme cytochrome c subunit